MPETSVCLLDRFSGNRTFEFRERHSLCLQSTMLSARKKKKVFVKDSFRIHKENKFMDDGLLCLLLIMINTIYHSLKNFILVVLSAANCRCFLALDTFVSRSDLLSLLFPLPFPTPSFIPNCLPEMSYISWISVDTSGSTHLK